MLATMSESLDVPITDDLAIDLVEAGAWLWKECKPRPRYELDSLVSTAAELLGARYRQYNLRPEYLLGVENTLSAMALVERQRLCLAKLHFVRSNKVSSRWDSPSEVAHLCARSAIVSVLRHFTGSASDRVSGLHQIHRYELGIGMDGLLHSLDQTGHVSKFQRFAVSWSQDIAEHERFLKQSAAQK